MKNVTLYGRLGGAVNPATFMRDMYGIGNGMRRVYICCPFSTEEEESIEDAFTYCRFVRKRGYMPIEPWQYSALYFNLDDRKERELAESFAMEELRRCDEIWVFGNDMSPRMRQALYQAGNLGLPVSYYPGVRDFKEEGGEDDG